ncbi:MAG: putative transcriptional regulator [Haloplasmataceae bacterium]|jgi:CarD family transcriptional regulator|nr:putative transcriptional regulator [Haloplasmataceae bacterium]
MFKVGDYVVHQTSGVCKIAEISNNGEREYYILYPYFENTHMKIVLPVDNCKERIKELMSKETAIKLIESIPNQNCLWIDNSRERKKEFLNIISSGNIDEISSILKIIYAKNDEYKLNNKKITLSDASIMKVAEKKLFEELAISLDIQLGEVTNFIDEHLKNMK